MERPLRIGTLGAAKITPGALLRPAAVVAGAEVVAVAARDRGRAETFAAQHGVEQVYDSYEALIDAPDLDLIYNPLPISEHAGYCIRALEAGKHVLCEKPFATNLQEAEGVLETASRNGRRVVEALHYRYYPAFAACLDAVHSGRIGDVTQVDAHFDVGIPYDPNAIRHRPDTGGGAMMDLGCYPLNWALALVEGDVEVKAATAKLGPGGVDEATEAELTFASGGVARLRSVMTVGVPFSARLEVTGTRGSIHYRNPLHPQNGGALMITAGDAVEDVPMSPINTYTWQLASVITALRDGATLPTEGEAILRQQRTLDEIYRAAGLAELRGA